MDSFHNFYVPFLLSGSFVKRINCLNLFQTMESQRRETPPALSLKYLGRTKRLEKKISEYLSSNCRNDLVCACITGEEVDVQKLAPKLEDINHGETRLYGMNPLHCATLFGHGKVVDLLIDIGANVNTRVGETIAKETALHLAAGKNYVKIVRALLAKGADANSIPSNYVQTPLHVASHEGHLETVTALLEGGAINDVPRPSTLGKFGSWCTPLHVACRRGHLDVVRALLEHGANIDSVSEDPSGTSVLQEAVSNQRTDVVNCLIIQGVKINVFDKDGLSPLHVAARNGNVDMIDLLIKHGSKVDSFLKDPSHTPLASSIVSGQCESVIALLKAGAKVDGVLEDAYPLYQAIRGDQNNLQIVKILLSFEANEHIPDELGYFPLHNAASFGEQDLLELFLQRGHDPTKLSTSPDDIGQQETALHSAVSGGSPSIVRLLVKSGVSVNCLNYPGLQTPIYSSVLNRKLEVTELLIELGADVNVKDAAHISPLHHAAFSQDDEIMKVLIQNGASLEAKSHDGLTPLLSATIQGTHDSVTLLVHFGVSVNITTIYGETALHFAAELNHLDKTLFLLNNGANVNAVDCNGASPLHLAAVKGHDDIVALLCKQNETKLDIKDNFGATPLHLAAFNGHEKVTSVLLEAGTNLGITLNGETASDISCRRGFVDVTKLLGEFEIPRTANKEEMKKGAIEKNPDLESLPSYLQSVLETDGVGILPSEAQNITRTVTTFIKDLLKAVGELDPRFVSHVTLSGSNAEGCKVGSPDEFDFMFFLPNLAEEFEFSRSADDPAGYYQVKLKKERRARGMKMDDLLKDGKYLFPQKIKACLLSHIEDVFLLKKIKVPPQIRFYLEEFSLEIAKYRIVRENKPGCMLYFEWRDGLYSGMQITVDLVPTLPFVCSKIDLVQLTPQAQKLLDMIGTVGEHSNTVEKATSFYLIPKPTEKSSEHILWRISTSQIETQILQRLPNCKKNVFILGKILLEQTGRIPQGIEEYGSIENYIHTYLLKTAFLHEVARVPEDNLWLENDVIHRLKEIFQLLKKSFEAESFFSFFIENYDLLRDDDILAQKAARIWIADAILTFLSDKKYFLQENLTPRKLQSILRSLRPETGSAHLYADITIPYKGLLSS